MHYDSPISDRISQNKDKTKDDAASDACSQDSQDSRVTTSGEIFLNTLFF